MLSKEFMSTLTEPVAEAYERLNYRLVRYIVETIIGEGGKNIEYAIEHSGRLGIIDAFASNNIRMTAREIDKNLEKIVRKALFQALAQSGYGTEITGGVERLVEDVVRQAKSQFNLTNTIMKAGTLDKATKTVRLMTEARNRALSTGALEAATHTTSMTDTIRQTIQDLTEEGIDAFVDRAGRKWSAEGYVSMNMRTTLHNASIQAVERQGRDLGLNIILVSSHPGARPGCAPYQGRCYSMDGTYGTIKSADGTEYEYEPIENTSKGEPGGLFGINCHHSFRYIEPELFYDREKPVETEEQEKKNEERYQNEQRARSIERKVRKYKETASLMNTFQAGAGSKYTDMAAKWTTVYNEFCQQNHIHKQPDRLKLLR